MTEKSLEERFDDAVERAAARFENVVEHGAAKLERGLNRTFSKRPMRMLSNAISFLAGIGLIVGAAALFEQGQKLAAKICLVIGAVAVVFHAVLFILAAKRK